MAVFMTPENLVKYCARAKYYQTPEGEMKLAQVQEMGIPVFRMPGYEEIMPEALAPMFDDVASKAEDGDEQQPSILNQRRALRRAKITAFDKILCNPDLDTFGTFTLSPEVIADRKDWRDAYHALKIWLSNGVTRQGLKYVISPERHKAGGIHFHGIMNSEALRLVLATNAHTGELLTHNGQPLYNIENWKYGFSSAEIIQVASEDREKVAKYIFKYMGKQGLAGKIGGRYVLSGGNLVLPSYLYSQDARELMPAGDARYTLETEHEGIIYREWNYI